MASVGSAPHRLLSRGSLCPLLPLSLFCPVHCQKFILKLNRSGEHHFRFLLQAATPALVPSIRTRPRFFFQRQEREMPRPSNKTIKHSRMQSCHSASPSSISIQFSLYCDKGAILGMPCADSVLADRPLSALMPPSPHCNAPLICFQGQYAACGQAPHRLAPPLLPSVVSAGAVRANCALPRQAGHVVCPALCSAGSA